MDLKNSYGKNHSQKICCLQAANFFVRVICTTDVYWVYLANFSENNLSRCNQVRKVMIGYVKLLSFLKEIVKQVSCQDCCSGGGRGSTSSRHLASRVSTQCGRRYRHFRPFVPGFHCSWFELDWESVWSARVVL